MKKFLSVLLALAVAFTFTFGSTMSAFAAVPSNTAVSKAMSCVQNVNSVAKQTVAANGDVKYDTTWEVKAANWDLAYAKAYDDALNAVAAVSAVGGSLDNEYIEVLNAALSTTLTDSSTSADINAAIVNYLVNATYSTAAKPALLAQLAAEKEVAKIGVNAVKTDVFSTTEYTSTTIPSGDYLWNKYAYVSGAALTAGDACYKAVDVADSIKAGVIDYIDAVSVNDADYANATAVKTAYTNMGNFVSTYIQLNGDTHNPGVEDADETWTYTLKSISDKTVLTKAVEESSSASDAAAIAAKKATIASNIANFKKQNSYLIATGDTKAAYDDYLAAYETAATYLAENSTYTISIEEIGNTENQSALVSRVKEAKEAIEDAAALSKETNDDNSAKYDAEQLAANLKGILIDLYRGETTTYTTGAVVMKNTLTDATIKYVLTADKLDYKNVIASNTDIENQEITFSVSEEGVVSELETENAVAYYDLEWAKVTEAIAAYNTSIDAAVTNTDVTNAGKALNKALAKIDPASTVLGYFTGVKLNATVVAEKAKLDAYVNALIAQQSATDPLVFDIVDLGGNPVKPLVESGAEGTLIAFYIDNNARTKEEITALYSVAKAVLDGAKTKSALKAEATAIVAQIAALPAKTAITPADKAAIEAAYTAYDELNDGFKAYVTNKSTLDDAIAAVQKAESDAIYTAYKALPAKSALTIADKAAVKAVADAIEAYDKTEMYKTDFDATTKNAVDTLLRTIKGLELDALKAAVKAIPATKDITAADEATIKAAREAYDAYVAEYGEELTSADVTALNAAEKAIAAAEATVAPLVEAEKWTATDVKASLFDSSRKLTIWRTSKTSIRVTSVGSVADIKDHGYTVQYKFYKKAPGAASYKLVKTTTSNKYTYTNLKKGTNKFQVKVVVKDADGNVVASKWTYYRAAKIK